MQLLFDAQQDPVFDMFVNTNAKSGREPRSRADEKTTWYDAEPEGELAVDIAENDREVLIVSTVAGSVSNKLEVSVHGDLLTIRGYRPSPLANMREISYIHQECFWGKFSRTIVLPVDVQGDLARASYQNGVLTVRIPKRAGSAKIPVTIVDE